MSNKKKISIIGGSFVLVAAVVACVVVVVVNNNKSDDSGGTNTSNAAHVTDLSTSVKAIKYICKPALYPQTCEEEITKSVGNNTDIKSLIKTAFQVSIDRIKEAANHSALLTAAANDNTTKLPLETCNKLFNYAVEDLEDAINDMLGYQIRDLNKAVYDLKDWLSAAHTYQVNCLDEFTNQTCDAAVSMKTALNRSLELTANAIQIVHHVGDMISDFKITSLLGGVNGSDTSNNNRRLLDVDEEGYPLWVSQGRRRLLQLAPLQMKPTVIVAKDGSGQFRTVKEGLAAMPKNNKDFVVMYVKEGVYDEIVTVEKNLNKLVLIGDGPTRTKITGSLNVARMKGIGTMQSATFSAVGPEFMARDIGFENSAGPDGHQAVAFRSQSENSLMFNCQFDGFQDTLYTQSRRQFFRDCTITGTVDFIFGNSFTIFQNCRMIVRKPMDNQQNMVTAHGADVPNIGTYYVFHNCTVMAEPALVPFIQQNPTYLGRPWRPYAKTIFLQSQIDAVIHPDGWHGWDGSPDSSNTCYYAEIDNRGAGANKDRRVKWKGVHELSLAEANEYTLDVLYQGADWVKTSGAPFFTGLLGPDLQATSHPVPMPQPQQPGNNQPQPVPDNNGHPLPGIVPVPIDIDIKGKGKKHKGKKGKKGKKNAG